MSRKQKQQDDDIEDDKTQVTDPTLPEIQDDSDQSNNDNKQSTTDNNTNQYQTFKIKNIATTDHPSVEDENWFKQYWRPAVGWTFIAITLFDFIIGPIGNGLLFAYFKIGPYSPWTPLTLQGGGLFYIAYGGILGIYTFRRTQEKKLKGISLND